MDALLWKRIGELFEAARELDGEKRIDYLREECGDDQSLFEQVQSLLDADKNRPVAGPPSTVTTLKVPGVIAERFRVVRFIADGGMGTVYEAEDLQLHERVALKTIRAEVASDSKAVERFKQEIHLGKSVTHPNVCRLHDLVIDHSEAGAEVLYLSMEFLEGETLAARIARGPLPEEEALPLIEDMADALSAAHQADVIHRDFKSGNVMLVKRPDRTHAVVTDFGLARTFRESDPRSHTRLAGTVDYMAPEQIRGDELTPAADIYALGVVMYEMVTGKRPFEADSKITVALKHLNDQPIPPRDLTPALDPNWNETILRCLKKAPSERFQSADEVKAALAQNGRIVRKFVRLRLLRPASIALVSLLLLLMAALFWFYRRRFILPAEKRVAVLKFENIGSDPQNDAFSDGFMDVLSSKLTQLEQFQGSLSVVPASDIRKERVKSARDAYRAFDANLVITGSIQRSPNGVHLIVNVVEARKLKQLRSSDMFLPQTDPAAMQEGAVKQVADLIDVAIHPDAQRVLTAGDTKVPGAYDYFVQGSGYLSMGRRVDPAIQEFKRALEVDPNYANAYAALGEAYWRKYQSTKDRQWVDQAWAMCQRALELSPQLAAAHVTLALLNSGTGHYDEAIQQARLAISLDPGNFQAYSELASALDAVGQTTEAEATLKKAIDLRPGYWNNYMKLGTFYYRHGKYQSAETPYLRVIDLVPDNPAGYTNLGAMYHMEGRESDAEQMLNKSLQVRRTPQAVSTLATVYFFEGRYADAVPLMEESVSGGSKDYMMWGNLGDAYRWSPGQSDKAPPAYRTAINLAEQALAVNPQDATALAALGLYRAKVGELKTAQSACQVAVSLAPGNGNVLFNAAIVYEIAGKRQRALEYLGEAVRHGYSVSEIAAEPELHAMRNDPQYQAFTVTKR